MAHQKMGKVPGYNSGMTGETDRKQKIGEGLYLTAFVLWMLTALTKYTYYKDILQVSVWDDYIFYAALGLLFCKLVIDFSFCLKNVLGLFVLVLFMIIACAGGRLQFAVMFALIYSAQNVPLGKILKTALFCQLFIFVLTVAGVWTGVLADVIWEPETRARHGLGFTHCMLASHFGLFVSVIYMAIVRRMTVARAAVILLINGILFYLTDGRTDLYLSILFVILGFVFGNLGERIRCKRFFAVATATVPFVSLLCSLVVSMSYQSGDPFWEKLNLVLNNRLMLGNQAIAEYGFTLFGQKIKWIGASVLYYKPSAVYNYVDNSYLMTMFNYGTLFILCYCAAMAYVLYLHMMRKDTMLVVCLLVTLAFGMINPQSMYLTYNPLLVLLADVWNPVFQPVRSRAERRKV